VESPPHLSLLLPLPVLPTQPRRPGAPSFALLRRVGIKPSSRQDVFSTVPVLTTNEPKNNGRHPDRSAAEWRDPAFVVALAVPCSPTQPRPTGCPSFALLRRVGIKPSPRQDVFSTVPVLTTNEPKNNGRHFDRTRASGEICFCRCLFFLIPPTNSERHSERSEEPPHFAFAIARCPILRAFAKGGKMPVTAIPAWVSMAGMGENRKYF
jgi:hypothetical protein